MRNDAIIDRRAVRLPNVPMDVCTKRQAQVGDLVWFNDDGTASSGHAGRVIGRIHYAPALEPGEQPIRDWLLVGVLSIRLSYVMERWIDPAKVTYCQSIAEHRAAVRWFMSEDMVKQPLDMVRQCVSELWSSFDAFLAYQVKETKRKGDV